MSLYKMLTYHHSAFGQPPAPFGWRHPMFAPEEVGRPGRGPEPRAGILIVEDDLLVASQMEEALRQAGLLVLGIAASYEEARQLAQVDKPVLAVVDIRLASGRDGVDTAIDLFRTHGTRCIFASAYSDDEARRRAEPAAPLDWLQKPYAMSSLTIAVRNALNSLRD